MRLIELQILAYSEEESKVTGEDIPLEAPCRCVLDLDGVTSVWSNPDGGININIAGECFWTKSYTMDSFLACWTNTVAGHLPIQGGPAPEITPNSATPNSVEPCTICGSTKVVQTGNSQKCNECGFAWALT